MCNSPLLPYAAGHLPNHDALCLRDVAFIARECSLWIGAVQGALAEACGMGRDGVGVVWLVLVCARRTLRFDLIKAGGMVGISVWVWEPHMHA